MDSKLDTQIAVVYTAILSGGQIGGIISGFLGRGFYICNENLPNSKIAAVTVPLSVDRFSGDRKNPKKGRWTNKQIFTVFSSLSTLSLLASAFVPNIYFLAVCYGIASVSLGKGIHKRVRGRP